MIRQNQLSKLQKYSGINMFIQTRLQSLKESASKFNKICSPIYSGIRQNIFISTATPISNTISNYNPQHSNLIHIFH